MPYMSCVRRGDVRIRTVCFWSGCISITLLVDGITSLRSLSIVDPEKRWKKLKWAVLVTKRLKTLSEPKHGITKGKKLQSFKGTTKGKKLRSFKDRNKLHNKSMGKDDGNGDHYHKKKEKKEAHPMQAIMDNHGDIKRWKSLEDFDLQAAQQRIEEDKFFHHDKRKPANEAAYHDTGAQSDHSNATSESESEQESDEEQVCASTTS